jgi:hypothetical protein
MGSKFMITCLPRIAFFIAFYTALIPTVHAAREWTSQDGKFKVKAELVDYSEEEVRLRNDQGKVISVPMEKMSKRDNEFVRNNKMAMYRYGDILQVQNPKAGLGWRVKSRKTIKGMDMFVLQTDEDETKGFIQIMGQPLPGAEIDTHPERKLVISKMYAENALQLFANMGFKIDMAPMQEMKGDDLTRGGVFVASMIRPDGYVLHFRLRSVFADGMVFHSSVMTPDEKDADKFIEVTKTIVPLVGKTEK